MPEDRHIVTTSSSVPAIMTPILRFYFFRKNTIRLFVTKGVHRFLNLSIKIKKEVDDYMRDVVNGGKQTYLEYVTMWGPD